MVVVVVVIYAFLWTVATWFFNKAMFTSSTFIDNNIHSPKLPLFHNFRCVNVDHNFANLKGDPGETLHQWSLFVVKRRLVSTEELGG